MSLVQPADFIGKYAISKNPLNTSYIQDVIDTYEPVYMSRLLGVELFELFDPLFPPYVVIFEPFVKNLDHYCCDCHNELLVSLGIKKMLLGFIMWEYYNNEDVKGAVVGQVIQNGENSEKATMLNKNTTIYNESVSTFRAIQCYVRENKEADYPTFKGTYLRLMNWF